MWYEIISWEREPLFHRFFDHIGKLSCDWNVNLHVTWVHVFYMFIQKPKPPDDQDSDSDEQAFRRRGLVSNWSRYDDLPSDDDEELPSHRGENFNKLLASAGWDWSSLYGPRQANLVLIAYASSEGSGEQRRFRRACASAQSRQNLRCSLIQAVSQEEPSDRKPDPWHLWMAGHAQLKFVMTEC